MVLTVTLNPAIDRTILADGFKVNAVNRGWPVLAAVGGKGINVSRAVLRLGGGTEALSVLGGETGKLALKLLRDEGIRIGYIAIEGETRTCYGIIDRKLGTETILNESGPLVLDGEREEFLKLFKNSVNRGEWVVLSGSAARGFGDEIYYDLISIANEKGAHTVLDATARYLIRGVEAVPYLVKLNMEELASLVHGDVDNVDDMMGEMERLILRGINMVVVTRGEKGALAMTKDRLFSIKPPEVASVNTWGSGDCVVAAMLVGLIEGRSIDDALKYGVAAGTANTLSYGAGFINNRDVSEILQGVTSARVL